MTEAPFVSHVLLYDRLVIPVPDPKDQSPEVQTYWAQWAPEKQAKCLDILTLKRPPPLKISTKTGRARARARDYRKRARGRARARARDYRKRARARARASPGDQGILEILERSRF